MLQAPAKIFLSLIVLLAQKTPQLQSLREAKALPEAAQFIFREVPANLQVIALRAPQILTSTIQSLGRRLLLAAQAITPTHGAVMYQEQDKAYQILTGQVEQKTPQLQSPQADSQYQEAVVCM